MPIPIAPILPVAGVPDELLKAINDRLRRLEASGGTGAGKPGAPGAPGPPGPEAGSGVTIDGVQVTY